MPSLLYLQALITVGSYATRDLVKLALTKKRDVLYSESVFYREGATAWKRHAPS